ncbi:uncharacterized protein LOC126897717 isoform X2 [Daktulosphaira vitifoliae]|nr:uncharacterized protein LOC126897717 isoform X2 [Daktulosphaira vitifoliae]
MYSMKNDVEDVIKITLEEIKTSHLKKKEADYELSELEVKEKNAIKKLIEVKLKKKRENEETLRSAQESLDILIQKILNRQNKNEMLIKTIDQKRRLLIILNHNTEEKKNHEKITRNMMEKIKEKTELVENNAELLLQKHKYEKLIEQIQREICNIKDDVRNKQQGIKLEINAFKTLEEL